jgi:hypothetical protein
MSLQLFLAAPPLAAVVPLRHDRDNNNAAHEQQRRV